MKLIKVAITLFGASQREQRKMRGQQEEECPGSTFVSSDFAQVQVLGFAGNASTFFSARFIRVGYDSIFQWLCSGGAAHCF